MKKREKAQSKVQEGREEEVGSKDDEREQDSGVIEYTVCIVPLSFFRCACFVI